MHIRHIRTYLSDFSIFVIAGNANNFDDMASFWRFEREQTMNNKANRKLQHPIDG